MLLVHISTSETGTVWSQSPFNRDRVAKSIGGLGDSFQGLWFAGAGVGGKQDVGTRCQFLSSPQEA